jgi:hypothetical protein
MGTRRLALSIYIGLDWRVFLFSLTVSVLTAVAFGIVPAIAVRASASRVSYVARPQLSGRAAAKP